MSTTYLYEGGGGGCSATNPCGHYKSGTKLTNSAWPPVSFGKCSTVHSFCIILLIKIDLLIITVTPFELLWSYTCFSLLYMSRSRDNHTSDSHTMQCVPLVKSWEFYFGFCYDDFCCLDDINNHRTYKLLNYLVLCLTLDFWLHSQSTLGELRVNWTELVAKPPDQWSDYPGTVAGFPLLSWHAFPCIFHVFSR